MINQLPISLVFASLVAVHSTASFGAQDTESRTVADAVIAKQRADLLQDVTDKWIGPQSPRDIDSLSGDNSITFAKAPPYQQMNLCNIHMHQSAEHKGGEFTAYAGNGDGKGFGGGYRYAGTLSEAELEPVSEPVCDGGHGGLQSGATIEVHYVHSTAPVAPGESLTACLSEANINPQLRVEAQVFVLVNDATALDFRELTAHRQQGGFHQAPNIPDNTGLPVQYAGSTTGPGFNNQGSPFQVSWSVRPRVAKVNIASVGQWCENNVFDEDHAHGVRNLVINPRLLSDISY